MPTEECDTQAQTTIPAVCRLHFEHIAKEFERGTERFAEHGRKLDEVLTLLKGNGKAGITERLSIVERDVGEHLDDARDAMRQQRGAFWKVTAAVIVSLLGGGGGAAILASMLHNAAK